MNMQAIDRFLRRYNQSVRKGSKEMVLTMDHAAELSSAITELMSKNVKLSDQLTNQPQNQTLSGEIIIDGGKI